MNDHDLEKHLQLVIDKPLPDCPESIEANVLRRIRLSRSATRVTESAGWGNILLKPALMTTLCIFTLLLSAVATYLVSTNPPSFEQRRQLASAALDFNSIQQHSIFTFEEETIE